jgi:Cu2+-exporting ATPase
MPGKKLEEIERLTASGRKTLVVGDGINDAPALAAGHVSMAPAAASAVSCTAADMVFLGDSLAPVARAYTVARAARRIVLQNFTLALVYNLIAVPVAVAGLASPLIAAVAMSSSSILVTLNALRLRWQMSAERRVDGTAAERQGMTAADIQAAEPASS